MMLLTGGKEFIGLIRKKLFNLNRYELILYICIVLLTILCVWNIHIVLDCYYERETTIQINNERPDHTNFPGITICGRAIFTPEYLASK